MDNPKPLVWLHGEVRTPPLSREARREMGRLLRRLQMGDHLHFPESRPMPSIAAGCHELRVTDAGRSWRLVYAVEQEEIVILDVFAKKTVKTPNRVMDACRKRLQAYREQTW